MNFRILLFAAAVVLAACTKDPESGNRISDNTQDDYQIIADAEKGWVRVKLAETPALDPSTSTRGEFATGFSSFDEVARSLGAVKAVPVFTVGGRFEKRQRLEGLHLWYDVYFDETIPVTRAMKEFGALAEVTEVEPLILPVRPQYRRAGTGPVQMTNLRESDMPFDDPLLAAQWHYNNTGELTNSTMGADINLFEAWKINTGHPDVIVAIIDAGVDFSHPDLVDNLWVNESGDGRGTHGWNFVRNTQTVDPDDHGTHVAGTVAAVNNNGLGVGGVAGGGNSQPGVRIMGCQIFGTNSSGGFADAFIYAADHGAVIAQNSWSYAGMFPNSTRDAIDYFIKYAGIDEDGRQYGPMRGGLVVFAASNDNTSREKYPAAYEKVIAVASIAPDYDRAPYSNFGSWINISAPGGSTYYQGKYGNDHSVLSTVIKGEYDYMEGTSMACPHVSGIAALIVSQHGVGRYGLSPEDVKDMLYSSAIDLSDKMSAPYSMGVGLVDAAAALGAEFTIRPSEVLDLVGKWVNNTVTVSWTAARDENSNRLTDYTLYWSEEEFTLNDIISDKVNSETVTVDDPTQRIEITLTDLEQYTKYYVGVTSHDKNGKTSRLTVIEGRTGKSLITTTPTPIEMIEDLSNIYFEGKGLEYRKKFNLDEYFADPDGNPLEFKVSGIDNEGILTATIEDNILTVTPVSYGANRIELDVFNSYKSSDFTVVVMSRDSRQVVDLYPNPVVDILNLRMGQEVKGELAIKIYNQAGQRVMQTTVAVDPFLAAEVDMSALSAGSYNVEINVYDGTVVRKSVVKK